MFVRHQCAPAERWATFSRPGLALLTVIFAAGGSLGTPAAAVETPVADGSDRAARGPLRVHPTNPRYFTDGSGKAVFLTGSHTWSNLQDYSYQTAPSPPAMEFEAYLAFLKAHNHNFFRLWVWESAFNPNSKQGTTSYDPMPYQRPGPGTARDSKPRFDLTRFNPAYFDRMRARVRAAGDDGIYVSVMLFNGFSIEGKGNVGGDPWQRHPLNPANNVNGVDGGGSTRVHTLSNRAVTALQEAYVRKVIDTVMDCDNVLYEISNEDTASPADTAWQTHFIDFIKACESAKGKPHGVGMTSQWPGASDATLRASPADWISPATRLSVGDGRKVILNDTDHSYFWTGLKEAGLDAQRAWVWENFTRGSPCLFMDPYLDPSHDPGRNNPAGGKPDPYWETLRKAMGHTRMIATQINLAAMVPRDDLASTRFCLADPGREYLVYLPEGGETVVDLSGASGLFRVAWINPIEGTTTRSDAIAGGPSGISRLPFAAMPSSISGRDPERVPGRPGGHAEGHQGMAGGSGGVSRSELRVATLPTAINRSASSGTQS
jgi:hypothetical protein